MARSGTNPPRRSSGAPSDRRFSRRVVVCLAAATAAIGLWPFFHLLWRAHPGAGARQPHPAEPAAQNDQTVYAGYAGSPTCQQCHPEEVADWSKSHHALAERNVAPAIDQGAFAPSRTFQHGKQSTAVAWSNGVPFLTANGLSGKPESYPAARVIGVDPLRQFLVSFPGGRWQATEAAYDPRSNQWFNVYGQEDRTPGEWGHWTGRGMNWNYMCASCHNTRLRRNYDPSTDTYHTRMAEMSVGCEACHGPLKAHGQWQNQFGKSGQKDPTLTRLTKAQTMDNCGACHARRTELTADFKPGDNFLDQFSLVTVDQTEHYYPDGQVHDEDYEYASFLSSRMHDRGVVCLDCHQPHTLKTRLPGNWLCLRCHNGSDTNAPVINPVTHSHHQVYGFNTNGQPVSLDLATYEPARIQQTGGECVNCHMPQTVYMQRHSRHDHGFTCPDPLLTQQFGVPNACNRCHQDKDPGWALKYCDQWFGPRMERPTRTRAQIIARARHGEPQSTAELISWVSHENSPYWQAVCLALLGPWSEQPGVASALMRGLDHTNALVRAAAASALESAAAADVPGTGNALRKALHDPVRSVRLAAASVLQANLPPGSSAAREFLASLDNQADQPAGQMQRGLYDFAQNAPDSALRHFQLAARWDPYSAPIHQELAVVLSALKRTPEAVAELQTACRLAPRDAESHYKLGLAFNELGDLDRAAAELRQAVELDPRHASAWYNLGLAQNALGQSESALDSLLRSENVEPGNARAAYARATILARLGRVAEAKSAVRRALAINPEFGPAKELLDNLSN